MLHYNFPGVTFSDAVSDSAPDTPFSVTGAPSEAILSFVLVSDQPFNFQIDGTATVDASPYVPANVPARVTIYGSSTISYITATGGSDGTIFITRVA